MNKRFSARDASLLFALLAVAAYFIIRLAPTPQFWVDNPCFSPRVVSQLVVEVSITALLAVGMLLVILPGHIDLSAGSGVGLIGGLATVLVTGSGWVCDYCRKFHDWLAVTFGAHAAAWFPPPPWPDPVAMLAALLVAVIFWSVMGTLIVRGRIQAFIVTLSGMLIFKGLFWSVIESHTIPVTGPSKGAMWNVVAGGQSFEVPQDWLRRLTTDYLDKELGLWLAGAISGLMLLARVVGWSRRKRLAIPGDDFELTWVKWLIVAQLLFIFVVVSNQYNGVPLAALVFGGVAFFIHTLTCHTRFGRYLYAIGGNEEAALVSGINVRRVTIAAFVLMGVIVAITGFMQTAYAGYTTTVVGDLMELDAVAACVIGGVSLKGGRGNVLGVFLGALIMATLAKGMSLMGTGPENKYMIRGAVLLLAVWMDTRMNRASEMGGR